MEDGRSPNRFATNKAISEKYRPAGTISVGMICHGNHLSSGHGAAVPRLGEVGTI
jgi:hypothetical protein